MAVLVIKLRHIQREKEPMPRNPLWNVDGFQEQIWIFTKYQARTLNTFFKINILGENVITTDRQRKF